MRFRELGLYTCPGCRQVHPPHLTEQSAPELSRQERDAYNNRVSLCLAPVSRKNLRWRGTWMRCRSCGHYAPHSVTRTRKDGGRPGEIRRRRLRCHECLAYQTTVEVRLEDFAQPGPAVLAFSAHLSRLKSQED